MAAPPMPQSASPPAPVFDEHGRRLPPPNPRLEEFDGSAADAEDDGSEALAKRVLGRSRRCGCFVFTADAFHALVLAFFAVAPVAVFCTSVVPHGEVWSILVAVALLIACLAILLCAVGCDPGIIPPASAVGRAEPLGKEVEFETPCGETTPLQVCRTCRVVRPFRSAHCPFCDVCVTEYDHHCGVLGSCVGERTFRFFTLFFYAVTALGCFTFVRSVFVLIEMDIGEEVQTPWGTWRVVAAIGSCVYAGCSVLCVTSQVFLYTQMACTGATQKDLYGSKARLLKRPNVTCCGPHNPIAMCICRLCGPMPPSRVAEYA